MEREKKERRALKRSVKRAGKKHRRAALKRDLREHPEDAGYSEEQFGRHESAVFNGQDVDNTRRRTQDRDD